MGGDPIGDKVVHRTGGVALCQANAMYGGRQQAKCAIGRKGRSDTWIKGTGGMYHKARHTGTNRGSQPRLGQGL
jgi:hypothetical protein